LLYTRGKSLPSVVVHCYIYAVNLYQAMSFIVIYTR